MLNVPFVMLEEFNSRRASYEDLTNPHLLVRLKNIEQIPGRLLCSWFCRYFNSPRFSRAAKPCAYQKPRPYDFLTESLNVGHDGRTDIAVVEPGCLALQVQEPT